jgi:hypothetical protein
MKVIRSEDIYLVPTLRDGKFGFMDSQGQEVVPARYDTLDERYLCGNVVEDFIVLPDKIVSKNGTVIWPQNVQEVEDIGSGFLIIKNEECRQVIHKTGFLISRACFDNAKILNGKFVAVQRQGYWSIMTLTGRLLVDGLDDLLGLKNVLVTKSQGKYKLITPDSLATLPVKSPLAYSQEFDDVKAWYSDLILVRRGDSIGLLNQQLEIVVPLGKQDLKPAPSAIIVSSEKGKLIYTTEGQRSKTLIENIVTHSTWIAVKSSGFWRLHDIKKDSSVSVPYDTVMFSGSFAIGYIRDSLTVYFSKLTTKRWHHSAGIDFIPGRDSLAFISLSVGERRSVYNERGERLFSAAADKIQWLASGLFMIQRNEKKGLLSSAGKVLLPVEYDAIATSGNHQLSLLKLMKFGLYDIRKGRLIKPVYDKNIMPYNAAHNVAFKDGYYGFVNWQNKVIGKFEFNEVLFWNDTSALVKRNSTWTIVEIESNKILIDKIKDFKFIQDTPLQKLAILHQGDSYGVFHSTQGAIIPSTFSYIINVGSRDEPLYFTEKHVEEALIFVVIYYNHHGVMLRKEVYDHDDYDKIYCDVN